MYTYIYFDIRSRVWESRLNILLCFILCRRARWMDRGLKSESNSSVMCNAEEKKTGFHDRFDCAARSLTEKKKQAQNAFRILFCCRSHHPSHQDRSTKARRKQSDLKFNKHLVSTIAYRYLLFEFRRYFLFILFFRRAKKNSHNISRLEISPKKKNSTQIGERGSQIWREFQETHRKVVMGPFVAEQQRRIERFHIIGLLARVLFLHWNKTLRQNSCIKRQRERGAKLQSQKSINACIKMFYVDSTDSLVVDVVLPPCGCSSHSSVWMRKTSQNPFFH